MTVRNIKKSLAGVEDIAIGIGTLVQERGIVHRVNVFPSSYSYIEMQQYEDGDFFRLYGSDVSYTDYRRNPAGTIGIPAGVGGVWEPLTSNDKIIGGNTVDGAYLVDATYLVWHAASSSNYVWSGSFPHTVAPGADPTAVGSGYVPRTDVLLRDELTSGGSTIDDIANLKTDLSADSGAGLIWYKRVSGVARSLLAWMLDRPASIKDYGAKVDGVTDDTAAILLAATNAKRIYIPDTGYPAIVDELVLDGISGLEIKGPGTLKSKALSITPTIRIQHCDDWKVSGIKIDVNRSNREILAARNSGAGLSIYNCQGYSVSRVEVFEGVSGAGILAIDDGPSTGDFSKPSSVKYCHVHDCGKSTTGNGLSDGMFLNQDNMSVHFNYIHDVTDYAIAGDYSRNMSIRWNRINNALIGVGVLGAKFWDVSFNWISNVGQGVSVTLSGNPAIAPYVSAVVRVFCNWISSVTRDVSGTPNGDAIFVDTSAVAVEVKRNFIDAAYRGIASDAPGVVAEDNRIANCADRGIFLTGAGSVSRGNTLIATGGEYYGTTEANKDIRGGGLASEVVITSFQSGWTTATGSFKAPSYYKRDGRIYLRGSVNPGTQTAGTGILNLPAGFRPSHPARYEVTSENDVKYVLQISPTGDLVYRSGTGGTNIQLDQISFPVA